MPKIDLDILSDDMEQIKIPVNNEIFDPPLVKNAFVNIILDIFSWVYAVWSGLSYVLKDTKRSFTSRSLESIAEDDSDQSLFCVDRWIIDPLIISITQRLRNYDIPVGIAYQAVLKRMAGVMMQQMSLKKPIVLTASPGLGKTEMLIGTLIKRSIDNRNFTAIVVTRRINDAVRIANKVNMEVGKEVCWVRPTFSLMTQNGKRCEKGYLAKDYKVKICRNSNCSIQSCPVKRRYKQLVNG